MRIRIGALLIKDHKLLLIYRNNHGNIYYVVPGGGQEAGETDSDTFTREVYEETGFAATIGNFAFELEEPGQLHKVYFAKEYSGTLAFVDPEFTTNDPRNIHEHHWVDIQTVFEIPLAPEIKEKLLTTLNNIQHD